MRSLALLTNPSPLSGRCPACDGVMDDSRRRLGTNVRVQPAAQRRTGAGRVVELSCRGVPVLPVVECSSSEVRK